MIYVKLSTVKSTMSLLKGIVFIPREKIAVSDSLTITDKKRRSGDHPKSKKEERQKKHKKKHSREHNRDEDRREDISSDEDDRDYKDFSKYDDEIKLIERQESLLLRNGIEKADKDRGSAQVSASSSSKQVKSKFVSLTESLNSRTVEDDDTSNASSRTIASGSQNWIEADLCQSDIKSKGIFTAANSEEYFSDSAENCSSESNTQENSSESAVAHTSSSKTDGMVLPSNQSVAELFRAKLKKTRGTLKPESITEEDKLTVQYDEQSIRNQFINKIRNREIDNHQDSMIAKKRSTSSNDNGASLKDYSSNRLDLNNLIKHEKFISNDMDDNFRDNVLRLGKNYKGTELGSSGAFGNGTLTGIDEEEDIDMKLFENKHETQQKVLSKKDVLKSIGGSKKNTDTDNEKLDEKYKDIFNRCQHCTGSGAYKAHLTVSRGEHTQLRLKTGPNTLGYGHCMILPIVHTSSFLKCEEEVDVEVSRYKSCLRRMFEKNGQAVLFLESALRFGRHPHCCIDVVPVPLGIESEARMCFREVSGDY